MLNTHYFARATTKDALFRRLCPKWDLHYVDIALACSACNTQNAASMLFLRLRRAVRINLPLCQKNDARRNFLSEHCGVSRIRTDDPLRAKQVLYQLSYNPA